MRSRLASSSCTVSLCRNMPPMLGHTYRESVAEEDGRNTGRTWTEDGQRRRAGPFVGLHRLYACTPVRSCASSPRREQLGALLRAQRRWWLLFSRRAWVLHEET